MWRRVPRDGLLGVVIEVEEQVLDGHLQLPHRGRTRDFNVCLGAGKTWRNPQLSYQKSTIPFREGK